MFRRRAFMRPMGRAAARAEIPPALRRANELMSSGHFAEAADIFDQFAHGALLRGGPRAPQFFLQAGRCRVLAGQVPAGMNSLKQGLTILANRGNFQRLQNAGTRVVAELNARGLSAEAGEIQVLLKQFMPADFIPAAPTAASAKPRLLPTKCPQCGGSLAGDEVEWLDDATAECPYCGSGVRAE